MLSKLLSLIVGFALAVAAPAASAQRDGSHDMDFSIGTWRTEVTIFKDPFNKPDDVVHMTGRKVARPIWGGKAVLEEIEAQGAGDSWQGATLFLYDPAANQWSQSFVDSSTGKFEEPSSIGGWREDGTLEFYWQGTAKGRAMLMRGTWKILGPDLHTYEIAQSDDGGRAWHPAFLAKVIRVR